MGLEQVYKTIDIRPRCFPYKTEETSFPSTDWRSVQHSDFTADYVAGPRKALPKIVRSDHGRNNRPHGQNSYHIWKINSQPVCVTGGVRHTESNHSMWEGGERHLVTEVRHNYTPKQPYPGRTYRKTDKRGSPAVGIVPGTELAKADEDKILPSSNKIETFHQMSSRHMSQFLNQKQKGPKPYKDNGVIYEDAPPPRDDPSWQNVSHLTGRSFSRRRHLNTRPDSIPVSKADQPKQASSQEYVVVTDLLTTGEVSPPKQQNSTDE